MSPTRTESPLAPVTHQSPASMLDWALAYARHEQRPVFPCDEKPGDHSKAPHYSKPDLENGHLNATTDPKQIADWWIRWPHALIGSPVPADLIVLDLDPRHGGTIKALDKVLGPLARTRHVISGRGDRGGHLLYQRPPGFITASVLKKVCPGVDIKLDTGYTILPPSLHPGSGKPYRWGGPDPVAALPERIREVLQPPRQLCAPSTTLPSAAKLAGLVRRVREESNTRNNVLFWAAKRLVEGGYPEQAYDDIAIAALSTGLSQWEVNKAINSARKALV
jgi:hypothetical protein